MQTFKTLMLREWMQHRLGWLLLGSVPFVIMVPLMMFGEVHFGDTPPPPGFAALIIAFGYIFFLLVLAGGAVAIQAPGLARRDRQDRSIEFWLSLPVGHSASIGATLLMHLLAMPLLLLGMAAIGSPVAALLGEMRVHGAAVLGQVPWGTAMLVFVAGVARLALGIVLAMLWLSPLLLAMMAASAWLKRWGVPVLGAVLGFGGLLLKEGYHQPFVFDAIDSLFVHARDALLPQNIDLSPSAPMVRLAQWVGEDALRALADLATPSFVVGLVIAAGGFGLMVLRRSRG
ncbi:hypothetical protein [Ideonella sp.]|uniref:hypothetical protein n=1 Tax=Ideonella sp. TaxID=1929293 RepID=UPI0035AFBC42